MSDLRDPQATCAGASSSGPREVGALSHSLIYAIITIMFIIMMQDLVCTYIWLVDTHLDGAGVFLGTERSGRGPASACLPPWRVY